MAYWRHGLRFRVAGRGRFVGMRSLFLGAGPCKFRGSCVKTIKRTSMTMGWPSPEEFSERDIHVWGEGICS